MSLFPSTKKTLSFKTYKVVIQTGDKSLVLLLFYGEATQIGRKLEAAVRAFDVYSVILPENMNTLKDKIIDIGAQIEGKKKVIMKTIQEIRSVCNFYFHIQKGSQLTQTEEILYLLGKEKKIQGIIDSVGTSNRLVNFKFWVPSDQEVEIQAKIIQFYKENTQYAEPVMTKLNDHRLTQPTFFKSSDFMDPFQTIVETFSTPRYKEMNPAVFTIATFPCFFGMMFGDIAHGSIILIFGLYLIASYKRISESKRSILRMVTPLRYLITLMGLFAVYSGAIYGELGSVNIPFFSSCYDLSKDEPTYNRKDKDCVYPFGIDWVWATTNQDVSFFNSFKMKLSIIFGVTQMLLGIVLKGSNSIFFGSMIDFFCEFIPQFVFLASSFGYMSVLIVIKWLTNWDDKKDILGDKGPPQIVGVFTSLTSVTPQLTILGNTEFQQDLQDIILIALLSCTLLMLVPKPFLLMRKINNEKKRDSVRTIGSRGGQTTEKLMEEEDGDNLKLSTGTGKHQEEAHDEESHSFGEFFIHQVIETIEFVLGSISNTASYLRLWALSLAHAELSKVFLSMIMGGFFKKIENNPILASPILVITFLLLAIVTIGVLLMMDVMECFLHTLRLHWVEFQNKFFKGEGKKYEAFRFALRESLN